MESKTSKSKKSTINVQGTVVSVVSQQEDDFISLTDIARHRDSERTDYIIQNWMRNRNTIEFLGLWEQLNNPSFKPIEFEGLRNQAGLNSFSLTAKRWIDATGATGLVSKSGRYGGTFAHKDIAMGLDQTERLIKLNQNAIRQLQSLAAHVGMKSLGLISE